MRSPLPRSRVLCFLFSVVLAMGAGAEQVTPPAVAAKSFFVLDLLSGQRLAAGAEDDRFEPASLTKLMTAYVVFAAMREGALDAARVVTVSPRATKAPGARMFLVAGRQVTVKDLLRGMIVQSANDAAVALAEAVGGSEEAFVARMNAQAQRLGLANTAFANPTGHPAPGHYASARENAESFRARAALELASLDRPIEIYRKDGLFRLHVGPYRSRAEASAAAERLKDTLDVKPHVVVR